MNVNKCLKINQIHNIPPFNYDRIPSRNPFLHQRLAVNKREIRDHVSLSENRIGTIDEIRICYERMERTRLLQAGTRRMEK